MLTVTCMYLSIINSVPYLTVASFPCESTLVGFQGRSRIPHGTKIVLHHELLLRLPPPVAFGIFASLRQLGGVMMHTHCMSLHKTAVHRGGRAGSSRARLSLPPSLCASHCWYGT